MTHRKRRRRENELEGLDIEILGRRLLYSECSASAQSRRRAHLVQEICDQAGVENPPSETEETKECVQLLQDTLSKSSSISTVGQEMRADGRLDKIISNILSLHESVSSEQRTRVLALVASMFTGAELKQLGFSFGSHQLKEARQLAGQKEFTREPRKPQLPESKRPKSEEFVNRLHRFLDKRSEAADDDVDGKRVVRDSSIRALHREFIAENLANTVSLSTFRALAMEKYCLPQRPAATVADGSSDDLTDKHRAAATAMETYRPLQPRPDNTPVITSSVPSAATTTASNAFAGFPLLETENTGLILNTQGSSNSQMISLNIPGLTDNTHLSLPLLLPSLQQTSQGMFQTGFDGLDIPTTTGTAAALFGNMGGGAEDSQLRGLEGAGYMPAIHNLFNIGTSLSSNPQHQSSHQQNVTSQPTEPNALPPPESSTDSLPSTFFYL